MTRAKITDNINVDTSTDATQHCGAWWLGLMTCLLLLLLSRRQDAMWRNEFDSVSTKDLRPERH